MKLARLFLAVLTASTLAACADSVTAPEAAPADKPGMDLITCEPGYTLERFIAKDGGVSYRCTGMVGSGG